MAGSSVSVLLQDLVPINFRYDRIVQDFQETTKASVVANTQKQHSELVLKILEIVNREESRQGRNPGIIKQRQKKKKRGKKKEEKQ